MNRVLVPLILLFLVAAAGGYYFLNHQVKNLPIPLPQGGVCDKETMTCSDGTVLHKTAPNCDFPPCPSSTETPVVDLSANPQGVETTIVGSIICLPHRNTSGPQTLECAFGLKADDGNNYSLSDPDFKFLGNAPMGRKVEIKGELTRKPDQKYNSAGVIKIESLTQK